MKPVAGGVSNVRSFLLAKAKEYMIDYISDPEFTFTPQDIIRHTNQINVCKDFKTLEGVIYSIFNEDSEGLLAQFLDSL